MRYRHHQLTASGNQQQAIQEAQELVNNADRQVWTALNDIGGAIKYIVDGEKQHPNRHDVVNAREGAPPQPQLQGNNYPISTSGQFSAFGSQPSGASLVRPSTSFGKPSTSTPSFGQPSSLGPPRSLFGPQTSGFGQSAGISHPGGGSFGQAPSSVPTFGQDVKISPFGPVQGRFPVAGTAVSGSLQQPGSAFTQPINPFGQAASPLPPNPFGQPPSIGNSAPNPGAFEKPTLQQPVNTFGQPTTAKPNPFASAEINQQPTVSGQLAGPAKSLTQLNPQAGQTGSLSKPAYKGSSIPVNAKRDSQGKLMTWKGKSVQYIENDACYRDTDGSWKKIWFPDGPPVFTKALELPDDAYDETTKENYQYMKEHGTFKDGLMPELPPKREWCNWNF